MKTYHSFILLIMVFIGSLFACVLYLSQGMRAEGHYKKQVFWDKLHIKAQPHLKSGDQFSLISWNMAFAHGEGSEGDGHKKKSEKEYYFTLGNMAKFIGQAQVSMAFLQEIDFNSERTYFINQAKVLNDLTGMSDIAPVVSWKLRYLPFPGGLFERGRHFKKIESGGAILSRYRLETHEYHLLEKPKKFWWFYNLFYLSRYIQKVNINMNGKWFPIFNVHLEAFDMANRKEHMETLLEVIHKEKPLIIAGDFNTFHTEHSSRLIFGDDNYSGDNSLALFEKKLPPQYKEALKEDLVFLGTFPAKKPNRRLDYIYYDSSRLELQEGKIMNEAEDLSDHLPIYARFLVK